MGFVDEHSLKLYMLLKSVGEFAIAGIGQEFRKLVRLAYEVVRGSDALNEAVANIRV